MRIGAIELPNNLFVAPMAGVTDRPFRMLCRSLGAGYAVSEMVTSQRALWTSLKTSRRADHEGEPAPIAVQIAGADPATMLAAMVSSGATWAAKTGRSLAESGDQTSGSTAQYGRVR